MAAISSAGIGSGLEVDSLITKLMEVEKKPVAQLQTQATAIQAKISAFGSVQSAVSAFRDASLKLTQATTWGVTTATSADPATMKVSTTDGAVPGNYAIRVDKLATSQSVVTQKTFESASSTVGSGTLRIEMGAISDENGFTVQQSVPAVDIDISPTDTLATVRQKINAAGAGVSAVIVNDATGARLIITSSATGAANGFRVTASGDAGLAELGYDPDSTTNATRLTQDASDAQLNVNGVDITSASNTLAGTIQGLTVNLYKTTGETPMQVSVDQDNDAIKTAITGFVDAYNAMAKLVTSQTKYDAATKTAGTLQGDGAAIAMQRQLRNALSEKSPASSVFQTINDIGLTTQSDGTIKVDDAKLTAALGKLPELKKMFTASDALHPENNGVAKRLQLLGDAMLGTDGSLTTRAEGLNKSLSSNKKQQDAANTRLTLTETRLRNQFSALDTAMAKMNALNAYISQQVTTWNKSTG